MNTDTIFIRRIILVGSPQDLYSPISTSLLQTDSYDVLSGVNRDSVVRVEVEFPLPPGLTIDGMIGRAAHIRLLECSNLILQLIILNRDVFPIK